MLFFEIDIDSDYRIYADTSLTVDCTNTDDPNASMSAFEDIVIADGWGTESEAVFITSAPTGMPSVVPSAGPTTLLPTAQPSITGLVVTIDVTLQQNVQLKWISFCHKSLRPSVINKPNIK